YPTGVAIVATRAGDGRRVGLTINSFASLSLDPPLILWSLVQRSVNLPAFRDCTHFTVSVLGSEQQELARRFASASVADKFEGAPVIDMPEGVPVIEGAVATLVCANDRCIDGGDHLLLLGRVLRVASSSGAPLVFHAGRFTVLPD
ncbi:MAG: flavin reductase family protein, partial [Burkholderiales bacterium]|nr:flavin reductase family protein [Burkholderiales bacterium]